MNDRLAILMFHDVLEDHRPSGYTVSRRYLRDVLAVVRSTTSVQLQPTFDDGRLGTFESGLPELLDAQVQSTLFVTTDFMGQEGFMDVVSLRRWIEAGQHIGSHAVTHRPLSLMAESEAVQELRDSRARLEDWVGVPVSAFAFPGGNDTERLRILALQSGYDHVYTSEPGFSRGSSRIRSRFTIRAGTPLSSIVRLGAGQWPSTFVADAIKFRTKRLIGAGGYRRLRAILRSGARRRGSAT